MEDIKITISLNKIVEIALQEQKFAIKKYLTGILGQPAGDLIDKFTPTEGSILDTLKTLSE